MSKRLYTNSKGLIVEVDSEHLDKAVAIKIELQKLSPSLRCDWKRHKKMMEEEGYEDSDTNESYRILVKDYQRKVGLLSTVSSGKDVDKGNKLVSLKNLLGELYTEKRDNQLILQEINKFKRDYHLDKMIAEEIVKEFKNFKIDVNLPVKDEYELSTYGNKAIVTLTDLHIGELIKNVYGNSYNYEIAKRRMKKYLRKVKDYCAAFSINHVCVIGLGDFVEHAYMRKKQGRNVEFGLAKQILKASELIIEFLFELSNHISYVEYQGIAGNHDRLQGDKDVNYEDDNANVIINYNIQTAIQFINSANLVFVENEDDATEINKCLNGKKIKLVHGHLDNGNKKDRTKSYISMQNEFFHCLVYGHLHNFHVEDFDHGRMAVGVGCLSGRNDYAKNNVSSATNASQMMMVVTTDGDIIPIKIDLQSA